MLSWTTGINRSIHLSLIAGLLVFVLSFLYLKSPHLADPFGGVNFGTWRFDPVRDGDDYGLSHRQCSAAFPKLYNDVDEMISRRQANHIAKADFDSVEGDHVRDRSER